MKVFGGGGMLRWWRKMVGGAENRALGTYCVSIQGKYNSASAWSLHRHNHIAMIVGTVHDVVLKRNCHH